MADVGCSAFSSSMTWVLLAGLPSLFSSTGYWASSAFSGLGSRFDSSYSEKPTGPRAGEGASSLALPRVAYC